MSELATMRWVIGVTGASGVLYALRLVEILSEQQGEYHLIFSEAAIRVLHEEEGIKLSLSRINVEKLIGRSCSNVHLHNPRDIGASVASGSFRSDGMVIVPCSMGSLGFIAAGIGQNLIHRAADVTIKEGRKLILVPRETPLSTIHLENMLKLSRMGVVMLPAMPGFYHKPSTISDIVDSLVMKILDHMGIQNSLAQRWGEAPDFGVNSESVLNLRRV